MVLVQPRTIKRLVRPLRLCAGDTISIIAPASPPIDPGVLARAKSAFEERGFKVELGKHIAEKVGFLAGSDTQRLRDLNTAIRSKKVGLLSLSEGATVWGGSCTELTSLLFEPPPR